ncbi:Coenzyme F420 hydrogenase/dehydrogenase, beta subunit C-terminal domain [Candidatus Bathyarchaeota archaeon]|nr:Coenzyme F420 hydrogenase/dehydrogenase, beta subunit C-terminal domain [Candidatus Bathyarchaeota archaeon]
MIARPKTFGNLLTEVVRQRLCVYCGACIATCPVGIILPGGEEPILKGACIACQLCYYQCPRTPDLIPFPMEEFEEFVFRRSREASGMEALIGVHRSIFAARIVDEGIRHRCQDGGAVTALAIQALRSGTFDAVVATVIDPSKPWKPIPKVFTDQKNLLEASGTKYSLGPLITGLGSAHFEFSRRRVLVVGVPCEVQALRRMQSNPFSSHKISEAMAAAIGLFCAESFWLERLMEYIQGRGIEPSRITRLAIKRGRFRVYEGDKEVLSEPIKAMEAFTRDSCRVCQDFTAELADVSVGGVGVPDGWSLVITRSHIGEELVKEAIKAGIMEARAIPEESEGLQLVLRLAKQKRERGGKV